MTNRTGANPIKRYLLQSTWFGLILELALRATAPVRFVRRLRYRKPARWQQMDYAQKMRWRCTHPDPNVDYDRWVNKARAKEAMAANFNVTRTFDEVASPGEIEPDRLPDTFVMKAAHGWNMNLLVEGGIIRGQNRDLSDKGQPATRENLQRIASNWMCLPAMKLLQLREKHYREVSPALLFEAYTPAEYQLEMFLFDGVCRITMVSMRQFDFTLASSFRYRLYDQSWKLLDPGPHPNAGLYDRSDRAIPQPPRDFLRRLESVCREFDHVRADFLVCGGQRYFGELTFTHNAGLPSLLGMHEDSLGEFWLDYDRRR